MTSVQLLMDLPEDSTRSRSSGTLRGAFVQIGIGLAIGIPASIGAGYAITTQSFGVKPYAQDILLVTTVVPSLAALFATLLPARKAAALEPIRSLRTE